MTSLALLGGPPVRIDPFAPLNTIGEEERQAVDAVMRTGILSQFLGAVGDEFLGGPRVRECEAAYAARLGVRYAVGVNSATTALQAAVAGVGVEPGDEVIVSPYTMSASAACVLLHNAIPVFADVEDVTFGLDPAAVESLITPRTRAIVVVHLFGHPAQMADLTTIARRHGIALIEDAAQSVGATWDGRETGTIGDAGVLSLNRHKIIQTGEGGLVVTDDETVAQIAQMVRNHGEVVAGDYGPPDIANTVGSNWRMGEIEAAIAIEQLKKLDALVTHRRRLAGRLTARLADLPAVTPPHIADGCTHSYYLYAVRYDESVLGVSRERFAAAVRAEGIPVAEGYVKPLYLQPVYQQRRARGRAGCPWTCGHWQGTVSYDPGICPATERLYEKEMLLLDVCRMPLTERDVDDVADAIEKVVESVDLLRRDARA